MINSQISKVVVTPKQFAFSISSKHIEMFRIFFLNLLYFATIYGQFFGGATVFTTKVPTTKKAAITDSTVLSTTSTTIQPEYCPDEFYLLKGKCVKRCEGEAFWSPDENKCICKRDKEVYEKDLKQCIKGGVWSPMFDRNFPYHAFRVNSTKLFPVKLRINGEVVVGNYNGSSILNMKNLEQIFTSTDHTIESSSTSLVTGNYLTFRIRGKSEVIVKFLSNKNRNQCYSISIAAITNHIIGIQKCEEKLFASTVFVLGELLSPIENRGFWVYWNTTSILMGLEGDLKQRIQLRDNNIQPFGVVKYYSKENVEWQIPSFK